MLAWHRFALLVVAIVAGACSFTPPSGTPDAGDDDPLPTVAFAEAGPRMTDELSGTITIDVALSTAATTPVTVACGVKSGGSAEPGNDFQLTTNTVTFGVGETTQSIEVTITNDTDMTEMTESFTLQLSGPQGATLGSPTEYQVNISDHVLPRVQFTQAATSKNENQSQDVTLTLTKGSEGTSTVELVITGTATQGEDFGASTTTVVTFADGEMTKMIDLQIIDDALDEEDTETMVLSLANPSGNLLIETGGMSTHSIGDNDAAPNVRFAAASSSSNEDAGTVNVVVELTAPSGRALSVDAAVLATSTALDPADAVITGLGTIAFAKGETMKTIQVAIDNDTLDEDNERFDLELSNGVNVGVPNGTKTHAFTILDDDAAPTIAFKVATSNATEDAATIDIPIVLSAPSARTITAQFAVQAAGSADDPDDYTIVTTSPITFAPGEIEKNIQVAMVEDATDEPNETVILAIGTVTNATKVAPQQHTFTINDDNDAPSAVEFDPNEVDGQSTEGDSPPAFSSVPYTLVLDKPSGLTVTVNLDFSGDAANPSDYTVVGNPVVFAPGEVSKQVTLRITNDNSNENLDTIIMQILNANITNGTAGANNERRHDIVDDD